MKFLPQNQRMRVWLVTIAIVAVALSAAVIDYPRAWNSAAGFLNEKQNIVTAPTFELDYSLGLDLQGGIQLIYDADLSNVSESERSDALSALRDAIERRVNFLGVTEPVVQVQEGERPRLVVELAGIDDPDEAVRQIGQTPFLEFKELRPKEKQVEILTNASGPEGAPLFNEEQAQTFCDSTRPQSLSAILQITGEDPCFRPTNLTGQFLESANAVSHPQTGGIQISLQFNEEGSALFEEITERNTGEVLAIYLDGFPVSTPVVNQKITGGQATITGNFTIEEARDLARNLNAGALPVPISLVSQQRVGAALGASSLADSLQAGIAAVIAVLVFLIIVYRLSGVLAVLSLGVYISFVLALIKLIPITLTLAGIAGLILSIGMAVDANILIFERLREELADGSESVGRAVERAFDRAWPSIRDGNISTLLTAVILFWFTTSFVKGFALTLGLGITVSLFSAMVVTRYFMKIFLATRFGFRHKLWTR